MASNLPAIEAAIEEAVKPGFRGDLLARGQARSMIWTQGEMPEDAPRFSSVLTYDLLAYGYSLLGYGLRVLEEKGDGAIARAAFEHAASAIESVVAKGKNVPSRDFHRLVAAAGFHLGQFSARAYSLLHKSFADANLTVSEQCLGLLMLRDMHGLDGRIQGWRLAGRSSDASLVSILESMKPEDDGDGASMETESNREFRDVVDVVVLALSDKYVSSMALATLALERGDAGLIEQAIVGFRTGLNGSAELNLVPQWWCFRLTIYLLGELWESSFHRRLPVSSAGIVPADWERLRRIFIASLYRREKSEFELWPSQLDAAQRALDLADNMVVSLPTSAGKTRVAELCILGCLSAGRKVVFVTPLRALSAQTETTLRRTFTPLGKTVSSLYGSIGVSEVDENVLNRCDIIVATPEKLDFALRSDPDLLNDVGLVVLDEGHMIGLGEREVRYEVQIQRLLKRSDADERRIICLSAVLPSGTELEDFVAWLTHDSPDGLLQKDWRPTRLRFGEVDWKGQHGQLNIQVGDEEPFVRKFVSAVTPPKLKRKEAVPRNQRELCLATAWRLVEDEQSVLIFCPERRSVEPFAAAIVDLNKRGVLCSVLSGEPEVLYAALTIGAEWLGPDHDLLRCLKLGVAIHHGALPTPYRKEVERLLQAGVLRVTVSSPTLAQGLNLSASTLIMFGIERNGEVIKSSEFRNVVGRAGRAYVDLEGVILYPMFDDHAKRRQQWKALVKDNTGREMESGLLRLLVTLLARMNKKLKPASVAGLAEYVLNNVNAWSFPELPNESGRVRALEEQKWHKYLTSLDTAILSLLGQEDVADDDIEERLDAILGSSLFARRLLRQKESRHEVIVEALAARTRYMWARTTATQRRGYFLAGLGFDAGQQLDAHAPQLEELLSLANRAVREEDDEASLGSIRAFAEIVFQIEPFVPKHLPENWVEILDAWLSGEPIAELAEGNHAEVLQFIEGSLVFGLPWAMEAVRVRALAHLEPLEDNEPVSDVGSGEAVAAVETGTLNRSAALLMRAGFNSRLAAIEAVISTNATFLTVQRLRVWLKSPAVLSKEVSPLWPTAESRGMWDSFRTNLSATTLRAWSESKEIAAVSWNDGIGPAKGTPLRIDAEGDVGSIVFTPDFEPLGLLEKPVNGRRLGLLQATAGGKPGTLVLEYQGPQDLYES